MNCREYPLSLLTAFAASSPKGTPFGCTGNLAATTESRPLGEGGIAVGDDGRGTPAKRTHSKSSNAKRLLHVLVQQPFFRSYSTPFFSISSSGISSVLTMVSICSSLAHSSGVKRWLARSTTVCR